MPPSFLSDVDAIVSSDRGFIKRAFEALWQPKGKRLFSPEEFVARLLREQTSTICPAKSTDSEFLAPQLWWAATINWTSTGVEGWRGNLLAMCASECPESGLSVPNMEADDRLNRWQRDCHATLENGSVILCHDKTAWIKWTKAAHASGKHLVAEADVEGFRVSLCSWASTSA